MVTKRLKREDVILERCKACKGGKYVAYDELAAAVTRKNRQKKGRFELVEKLEAMAPEERFAFWQNELSTVSAVMHAWQYVRPAAVSNAYLTNDRYDTLQKANTTTFEEQMFPHHPCIHVAGRCTDCGECSQRVCPQHIPLHLLNRKFIKDIDEFYGVSGRRRHRQPCTPHQLQEKTKSQVSSGRVKGCIRLAEKCRSSLPLQRRWIFSFRYKTM